MFQLSGKEGAVGEKEEELILVDANGDDLKVFVAKVLVYEFLTVGLVFISVDAESFVSDYEALAPVGGAGAQLLNLLLDAALIIKDQTAFFGQDQHVLGSA